jgi:hypothetical protein
MRAGLRRWTDTESVLEPFWSRKTCGDFLTTLNGPEKGGDKDGWEGGDLTKTNSASAKAEGIDGETGGLTED